MKHRTNSVSFAKQVSQKKNRKARQSRVVLKKKLKMFKVSHADRSEQDVQYRKWFKKPNTVIEPNLECVLSTQKPDAQSSQLTGENIIKGKNTFNSIQS